MVDDRFGITTDLAVKAPCRAVSTAALTLFGEQTVNGVAVVENDRVLVKDQADLTENGIYTVSETTWLRAADFDGNRDVVQGTLVVVYNGSGPGALYQVSTPNPIVIGEDDIEFNFLDDPQATYPAIAAEISAGVTVVNPAYEPGNVLRYGTNTTPGTTLMTSAFDAALAVANAGHGVAYAPAGTYLVGKINWPGNNLTLRGASSGYSYNTSATPKTKLLATTGTQIILDLVQTGGGEDRTGNHIVDIDVDGNSIALVGCDVAGANVFERCRFTRCTESGMRIPNWTNSSRLLCCAFNSNTGWGLHLAGVSSTNIYIEGCLVSLNTLGGVKIEGCAIVEMANSLVESNAGPAFFINRAASHSSSFSHFKFSHIWMEDNGSASPFYTIVIDSELSGDSTKDANRILFERCRISSAQATRKYLNVIVGKWIEFNTCAFSGSTQSDALTLASRAINVSFIECGPGLVEGGLTAVQIDAALATGTRCWSHDREITRVVGAAAPAAAFTNSWVNSGGDDGVAEYWFNRDGEVELAGSIKTGSVPSSAFTLPVGYRPTTQKFFAVDSNGAFGTCVVNTDGTVVPTVGSSTRFSLDGIRFRI